MKHYRIVLPDGHRVGVTEGGEGIPFVFLHGFSANRKLYVAMLDGLVERGYRVIALDMAGHGDTDALPFGHTFADVLDVTTRALDQLGIDRAVMAGHSLGGRLVAEFAATHPERVMAAVLLDPATGEVHDDMVRAARGFDPFALGRLVVGAALDLVGDMRAATPSSPLRFTRGAFGVLAGVARSALGVAAVGHAAWLPPTDTVSPLRVMRDSGITTITIHGERDALVPWASAVSTASHAGGSLYQIVGAHHSWMLADGELAAGAVDGVLDAEVVAA